MEPKYNVLTEVLHFEQSNKSRVPEPLIVAADILHVKPQDITGIALMKKGMTNHSFVFATGGNKYIMRIPGEGTKQLIDRYKEAAVYKAIEGKQICDDLIYLDPQRGYKIARYLPNVYTCDPLNEQHLVACMEKLRSFHQMELSVPHTFDIFEQINCYETLWNGMPSQYEDYEQTKKKVQSLRPFIERQRSRWVLTHIDAVPDNFLFVEKGDGTIEIQLIDWEYAGMQDPDVDLAMFCIYSMYEKNQVDHLIDLYFDGHCMETKRAKIYCYVAACGLLWSNWCEYKRQLGVEFGEYAQWQYNYGKEYYCHAAELCGKELLK